MNETALVFGPSKSIAGVVASPTPGAPARELGVVILNAGVLHRVGPARVHVSLARALQPRGFTSLRFDFSGIGDSPRRESATSFADLAVAEATEAMDFLSRSRGLHRFVLVGICSGADAALRIAQADPRVVAGALVDGYNIPTPSYVLLRARRQLFKVRSWRRLLSGQSETLRAVRATAMIQQSAETSIIPTYSAFIGGVQDLADRGTSLFLIYTAASAAFHRYKRGLRWRTAGWRSRGVVQVEHLEDTDHTFTLVRNQKNFVSLLAEWITRSADARAATVPVAVSEPLTGS